MTNRGQIDNILCEIDFLKVSAIKFWKINKLSFVGFHEKLNFTLLIDEHFFMNLPFFDVFKII